MLEGCNKNVERVLVIISNLCLHIFVSLACAFRRVIKANSLNIERVREFQLSVKVLSPMYQYFIFEKLETLQRMHMYGLITIWSPSNLHSFQWLLFPLLLLAKS